MFAVQDLSFLHVCSLRLKSIFNNIDHGYNTNFFKRICYFASDTFKIYEFILSDLVYGCCLLLLWS